MDALALDVATPLPLRVVCTIEQWRLITTVTQPALANQLAKVRLTLIHPDEVRESPRDPTMLLYYRRLGPRWMATVVKRANGQGFLVTAYPAERIKPGARLWPR